MARELAAAERAAVYARIGTTTQRFGTLASWLVDVLNYLTGNLDREGGAMFPLAAAAQRNSAGRGPGRQGRADRALDEPRQRRCPSRSASCPSPALAEEITTPGDGPGPRAGHDRRQPAGLDPDSAALEAAVDELDFVVSIDIYVNETTRRADVILPAPEPLAKAHYDTALYQFGVRSVANWSPAVLPLARRPARRSGRSSCGSRRSPPARAPDADIEAWDDLVAQTARRARGRARRVADRGPRRRTRSSPRSASAAAPSG